VKKKSGLTKAAQIFLMMIAFGAFLVLYVGLKKKCDDLIRLKNIAEEELKNQSTKSNNLFARLQSLTSEERIVPIAIEELGMIIADPPVSTISINSESIADIQTLLQEFHD
jgi:cell division protein FtsL